MKDSLLSEKDKLQITRFIEEKDYSSTIPLIEKVKTGHAGTAKTRDKRFVINEIIRNLSKKSVNNERDYFTIGNIFCNRKEDAFKEMGISLVWKGFKYNPKKVKELLLKAADDPNWEVREYAAGAFIQTLQHNEDFYETILQLRTHPSENIRRAVLFSALALLDKRNLSKAFSFMEVLMFDGSKYVRRNLGPFILGSYFGNKFPKETLSKLKKWSKIRDENVRWNIIMCFNNSFGNKHPVEALNILKYFNGDVDLIVKRAMNSTLNFLNKRYKTLVEEFKLNHSSSYLKKSTKNLIK